MVVGLQLPIHSVVDSVILEFAKLALKEVKEDAWQSRLPNLYRYYTEPIYKTVKLAGLIRLKDVEQTAEHILPTRYTFQEKLHTQVIRAMLRTILGSDYEATVMRVCEDRGWDGPKQDMLALASRRSGKTVGFASICAAILVCVPFVQVVVISVSQRSSSEFVIITRQFLEKDERGKKMLVRPCGAEQLRLRTTSGGASTSSDERRIRSFPGGGKSQDVSCCSHFFFFSSFSSFPSKKHHRHRTLYIFESIKNKFKQKIKQQ